MLLTILIKHKYFNISSICDFFLRFMLNLLNIIFMLFFGESVNFMDFIGEKIWKTSFILGIG